MNFGAAAFFMKANSMHREYEKREKNSIETLSDYKAGFFFAL